ncbi:MAG: hypothetical protein Q9184_004165 [Pyrenodesmia sp. 2 TL-2023]
MATISKQPGWRSASRAQEKKRYEEARAVPAAAAPQTVNERIEARRIRTLASLGPKIAKPAAKLEAGVRRKAHPLQVSSRFIFPSFISPSPPHLNLIASTFSQPHCRSLMPNSHCHFHSAFSLGGLIASLVSLSSLPDLIASPHRQFSFDVAALFSFCTSSIAALPHRCPTPSSPSLAVAIPRRCLPL